MVAEIRVGRGFHIAQQGVHLGQGQGAVGAYRTMARHGGQQAVQALFQCVVLCGRLPGGQHFAGQLLGVGARQQGRHAGDGEGVGATHFQVDAQIAQGVGVVGDGGHVQFGGLEDGGDQQRLPGDPMVTVGLFQALQHDALMRGVHVHDDQTIRRLRQDVDAVQLGQGKAHAGRVRQWRRVRRGGRGWRRSRGLSQGATRHARPAGASLGGMGRQGCLSVTD